MYYPKKIGVRMSKKTTIESKSNAVLAINDKGSISGLAKQDKLHMIYVGCTSKSEYDLSKISERMLYTRCEILYMPKKTLIKRVGFNEKSLSTYEQNNNINHSLASIQKLMRSKTYHDSMLWILLGGDSYFTTKEFYKEHDVELKKVNVLYKEAPKKEASFAEKLTFVRLKVLGWRREKMARRLSMDHRIYSDYEKNKGKLVFSNMIVMMSKHKDLIPYLEYLFYVDHLTK